MTQYDDDLDALDDPDAIDAIDNQALDLWQHIEADPDGWTVRQQADALLAAGEAVARRLHAQQAWLDALTQRAALLGPISARAWATATQASTSTTARRFREIQAEADEQADQRRA